MQDQNDILIDAAPPPPYQVLADDMYNTPSEMDTTAWPSSYYGRSKRIDLAKFYQDILKASTNTTAEECNGFIDSSSDEDEQQTLVQNNTISVTPTHNGMHGKTNVTLSTMVKNDKNSSNKKKRVRFTDQAPIVHEYEPEYDELEDTTTTTKKASSGGGGVSLFDEGWPGRTKVAMKSDGFMDFKSKIEAKLGAINDPSLIYQLDSSNSSVNQGSLLFNCQAQDGEQTEEGSSNSYRGYYRHRKSPLVKKLNLKPIPNSSKLVEEEEEKPTVVAVKPPSLMNDIPSPSNSYTDSPITPKDNTICTIPPIASISSTSSTSSTGGGGSKWLNRTLSKLKRSNSTASRSK